MEVLEEKVNLYESNGFSLEKLLENEKEKCQKLTEAKDKEIEQLWLEIDSKQAIIGALEELQANSKSQFEKRNKTTSDKPKEKTHPAISKIESYVDDHNNLIVECPDIWVFRNSFFFAGVVGTTIGYGDVYPTTRGGKIFSMFYALTSVPFFNFLLVISLTTVGFGDITPSFKDSLIFVIYRFMVLMWIFFGLAYIGGLAPLINEIFNNYIYAELYMKVKRQFSERWLRQNEEAAKISELVQKVHVQEILTEFEDELNAYSVNRQKRRVGEALVRPLSGSQDFQYSFEGTLYISSPGAERATMNIRFTRQLPYIDDSNENLNSTSLELLQKKSGNKLFKDL